MATLSKFSNEDLDKAFTALNLQLFAAENVVVRNLLYSNLQALTEEITKRDKSLTSAMRNYLTGLKLVMMDSLKTIKNITIPVPAKEKYEN